MSIAKAMERVVVAWIERLGEAAVALSGGLDSSVVSALAHRALGEKAIAIAIDSPLNVPNQLDAAKKVAEMVGIPLSIVKLNELEVEEIRENTTDRCYHCRLLRMKAVVEEASRRGVKHVLDGTNADDLRKRRPGLRALRELGILSPLAACGVGEREVEQMAKSLGIGEDVVVSDSCLATRVPYGVSLEKGLLEKIARAEEVVKKAVGAKTVRVRHHRDIARIEVGREERRLFTEEVMDRVFEELRGLGYKYVTLDLRGYVEGVFDEA